MTRETVPRCSMHGCPRPGAIPWNWFYLGHLLGRINMCPFHNASELIQRRLSTDVTTVRPADTP